MVETRISKTVSALAKQGRSGLITFITAGDPNFELSLDILMNLKDSGADIIELGMPFSDPMADGPSIQESSQRALASGINLKKTLEMVERFRIKDQNTPIVLMGYFNPIYIYGTDKFVTDAEVAGVDGLIIVDLPPEETELTKLLTRSSIDFIYLVAPTTNEDRLAKIIKHAGGFLYYVSVTGITGTRAPNSEHVRQAVKRLQRHTDLPIAVGFGIREPEQAAEIGRWADFVVVGSALVSRIGENIKGDGTTKSSCKQSVLTLVSALSEAISSNKSAD